MGIRNVAELISRLQECDPQAPVALATQPGWPFKYTIGDVQEADDGTVYVAEGAQVDYLSAAAREAIGW